MIDLIKLELLYRKYRNGLRDDGKSYKFTRLKTFISFCAKRGYNYLSKDLIDEWCIKHPIESINSANHRIAEFRNFIAHSNKQRYTNIPLPLLLPAVRKQRKGMVETEFSVVRYKGDQQAADNVYKGVTPLTGEDIADTIVFTVTRPAHICLNDIQIMPTAQASSRDVNRK